MNTKVRKDENGHEWQWKKFPSTTLEVCKHCGFMAVGASALKPCKGPIKIDLRTEQKI